MKVPAAEPMLGNTASGYYGSTRSSAGVSVATMALIAAVILIYVSGSFHLTEILGIKRQLQVALVLPLMVVGAYYAAWRPERMYEPLLCFVLIKAIVEVALRRDGLYILDNLTTLCALIVIFCAPPRNFEAGAKMLVVFAGTMALMALLQWLLLFVLPELGQYRVTVTESGVLESPVRHPVALLGLFSEPQYTLLGRPVPRLQSFAREPSLNVVYFLLPACLAFFLRTRTYHALGAAMVAFCLLSLSGSVFLAMAFAAAGWAMVRFASFRFALTYGILGWLALYLVAIQWFGFDAILESIDMLTQYGDFLGKSESLPARGGGAIAIFKAALVSPFGVSELADLPGPWVINVGLFAGWPGMILLAIFLYRLAHNTNAWNQRSERFDATRCGSLLLVGVITMLAVFNDYQMNNYAGIVLVSFIYRMIRLRTIEAGRTLPDPVFRLG